LSSPRDKSSQEFRGTDRFELVRRIGAGGMGVVYETIDRDSGTHIALKTLRSLSAEALFRFKNEFRALQDIHHENLVRLGELFEEQGQWFFTMEIIEGSTFLGWVRDDVTPEGKVVKKPERNLDEDQTTIDLDHDHTVDVPPIEGVDVARLRSAFAQLAKGVFALHEAGKVHRDIKPSNILVSKEGRVVLLDFGLITDANGVEPERRFVGTVGYMAPEQTEMKPIGPEADWYAVGVVLYQSITGRLPVLGTMHEVVAMKRTFEPAPPRLMTPGVPEDLDRLCMDLLQIEPSKRPSGRDVLRRLGVEDAIAAELTSTERRFVGRRGELQELERAFNDVRGGRCVTVIAQGESGVGKSALVRKFTEQALVEAPRTLILRGRCYERESVPYKAVDGLIDAVSRYLTTVDAGLILPRQRGLIGQVFPVMRRVRAVAEAPLHGIEGLDPQILRARLFSALRELFQKIAERQPLVLVIDDLQWADADSLAMLAGVLRPPDAPHLLLLATMRSSHDTDTFTRPITPSLPMLTGDVRRIEVGALPKQDAEELATILLRDAGAEGAGTSIASEAAGHPLFIGELVRRRVGAQEGTAPLKLDDALWARILRLDERPRRTLEVVAVAGTPISQECAADALQIEFGYFTEHVTLLRSTNLVRTGGARRTDVIEPYHDRVREAVLKHLEASTKRALHEQIALALEASKTADPESLSVHWRGAGNVEKAFEHTLRAAEHAAEALAFDRAARLYQIALELKPDGGEPGKASIDTRLGDALASAGRGPEAARAYLAAAAVAGVELALDLRRRAADQLLRSGHVDEALATMKVVLAAIDMELPTSSRSALASLMFRRAQIRLRGLSFKERAATDVPTQELRRIDTCLAVGTGLGLVDTIVGSYFQTRGLILALEAGEPTRVMRAIGAEACFCSAAGGRAADRTSMLVTTASALAKRLDNPYSLGWAAFCDGVTATLEGRWRRGYDECDRAESILRDKCTGMTWEIGTARWFAAWSLVYLGQLRELSTRIPSRLREANERGDLYAEISNVTGLQNMFWLMQDRPGEATERCREAMRRWSQKKFHVEHWWAMLAEAQAELYSKRGNAALAIVEERWPALDGSLLLMCQLTELEALHLRARASLSAAVESPNRRAALHASVERDAKKMLAEKMPWSTPLAHLLLATVAFQNGEKELAAQRLKVAIDGLDEADMALYAIVARYRLGVLRGGERGRALTATAVDWLRDQGVEAPERFVDALAPGF
jgi:hypothetical protein